MGDLSAIHPVLRWLIFGVEGLGLFHAAFTLFDVVHYDAPPVPQVAVGASWRVGALHQAHHDFYTDSLQFDGATPGQT